MVAIIFSSTLPLHTVRTEDKKENGTGGSYDANPSATWIKNDR